MNYLLIQYAEIDKPVDVKQFNDLPEVVAWLTEPEQAFKKWCIYEIARQVPYQQRVCIEIGGAT